MSDETETPTAAAHEAPPAPEAPVVVPAPAEVAAEVPGAADVPASEVAAEVPAEAASGADAPVPESAAEAESPERDPAVKVDAEPAAEGASEPPAEPESKPKRKRAPKAKGEPESEPEIPAGATADADAPAQPVSNKKWYAIKVQSGREDTIKAALLRKVRIEGLEDVVGRIEIPVEEKIEKKQVRVKDKKTGEYTYQERKVTKRLKKFYGYIFAELEFNERTLFLIRETSGVGDFLNMRAAVKGAQPIPEPMPDHEVQSMLTGVAVKDPLKKVKVKLDFEKGDKVRIRDGSFANSEGEVKEIREAADPTEAPKVAVVLTFWGRPLDVELDASQVEKV